MKLISKFESSLSNQRPALGLARLLVYALHDAEEIGPRNLVIAVERAVKIVKLEYRLTDRDILLDTGEESASSMGKAMRFRN